MPTDNTNDSISRENRRSELAQRLIWHGVRTELITQLTGLSRDRQATVRRRLMVPGNTRYRGPARSPLSVFLSTPLRRAEAAAFISLCSTLEIPVQRSTATIPKDISLTFVERLCEAYEAYCGCFPRTEVQLEEFIALRDSLATGDMLRLGRCRFCRCVILVDRFDSNRECIHCSTVVTAKAP